jgi:hypothetical protein
MRRLLLAPLALCILTVGTALPALADDRGTTHWRVTIENLTPPGPGAPGSQPLSPPAVVVHDRHTDVFTVGEIATHPVAAIAEDANNAPLLDALTGAPGVHAVFTATGGPIPSGTSATFDVETQGNENRLSIVTMLVNTNDAFTGLDALQLRGQHLERTTMAYDAGSEQNNELAAFIPGPCCNNPFVRDPEGAPIRMHPGVTGVGDLDPALYDWPEPAARITVDRVS